LEGAGACQSSAVVAPLWPDQQTGHTTHIMWSAVAGAGLLFSEAGYRTTTLARHGRAWHEEPSKFSC